MEKIEVGMPASAISAWRRVQIYFNVLNHVLISSVAIYMSFLCYRAGNLPISWHSWLCTIGVSAWCARIDQHNFGLYFRTVSIANDTSNNGILFGKCVVSAAIAASETSPPLGLTSDWIEHGYRRHDYRIRKSQHSFPNEAFDHRTDCRNFHAHRNGERYVCTVVGRNAEVCGAGLFEIFPPCGGTHSICVGWVAAAFNEKLSG